MEFSLPEFPATPAAQAAFVAAVVFVLFGFVMAILPSASGRLFGLASRETRPGAIGELRTTGGFLAGFALAALLFDQPNIYVALGTAIAFAAFGRLLAMMSDQAGGFYNFLLLLLQAVFAAALLTYLFDVWTPDSTFAWPTDFDARLVFSIYALLGICGFFIMFAPRVGMALAGIAVAGASQAPVASVRSQGGFLLGAGLASALIANPMQDFAMAAAFIMSAAGRILALVTSGNNRLFNLVMLILQAGCGFVLLATVFGWI